MTEPGSQPQTIGQRSMVRNAPLGPTEWEALLDRDDTTAVETDSGEMALTLEHGQLQLWYAFESQEAMKSGFGPMWRALHQELPEYDAPYVALHLVEIPNRQWIEPLAGEAEFEPVGEWVELEHHELAELTPPDFPPGITMRKGSVDDCERIVEIAEAAYGEQGDGATAVRARCEAASWVGVMEDGGATVAYALNGAIERGTGQILSLAVAPEAWGRGLGGLMLGAAAYQLASRDARRATVRGFPNVPRSVETAVAAGFRAGRRGIEYRRPTDEDEIERRHAEMRRRGMKVRFGSWR